MGVRARKREISKMVARYAKLLSISVANSGHGEIIIEHAGTTRQLFTGGTPSCPHALNQFERDVKKAVREMELADKLN